MADRELMYFNGPGRGECIRLILHAGSVSFKDTRVNQPDWPAIKSNPESLPGSLFGYMPCLKDGDFKITQSQAIQQYAADLAFPDRTPQERARDGMFLGIYADLQSELYKCLFGTSESKEAAKSTVSARVSPVLERLEHHLPGGFVNGKAHPTAADIALFDIVTSPFPGLKALGVDLAPYPKLQDLVNHVAGYGPLKSYLAARGF